MKSTVHNRYIVSLTNRIKQTNRQTLAWDAKRFGMRPRSMWQRVKPEGLPIVLINSIPKAGTHLIEHAVCLHPSRYRALTPTINEGMKRQDAYFSKTVQDQVLCAHLPWKAELQDCINENDIRVVFVVRDPVNILMSRIHYVLNRPDHRLHQAMRTRSSLEDRIEYLLEGSNIHEPFRTTLERFCPWLEKAAVVARFEEVIEPSISQRAVREIFDNTGTVYDDALIAKIACNANSSASPTFRHKSAKVQASELSEMAKASIYQCLKPLPEKYGYSL